MGLEQQEDSQGLLVGEEDSKLQVQGTALFQEEEVENERSGTGFSSLAPVHEHRFVHLPTPTPTCSKEKKRIISVIKEDETL